MQDLHFVAIAFHYSGDRRKVFGIILLSARCAISKRKTMMRPTNSKLRQEHAPYMFGGHPLPEPSAPTIVYVSAVLEMMPTPLYGRVLAKARALHSYAALISGRDVWANREGWRYTYESILQLATHAYVISHSDGTVGMGLFRELVFLQNRNPLPARMAMVDSRLRIKDIADLGVLSDQTPKRFAKLLTDKDLVRELAACAPVPSHWVSVHGEG
jgi:hypothetical protein